MCQKCGSTERLVISTDLEAVVMGNADPSAHPATPAEMPDCYRPDDGRSGVGDSSGEATLHQQQGVVDRVGRRSRGRPARRRRRLRTEDLARVPSHRSWHRAQDRERHRRPRAHRGRAGSSSNATASPACTSSPSSNSDDDPHPPKSSGNHPSPPDPDRPTPLRREAPVMAEST
jgi:hypothetical protein